MQFMQRAQEKEKAKPEEESAAEEAAESTEDRGEIVLGTDEDGMGWCVLHGDAWEGEQRWFGKANESNRS